MYNVDPPTFSSQLQVPEGGRQVQRMDNIGLRYSRKCVQNSFRDIIDTKTIRRHEVYPPTRDEERRRDPVILHGRLGTVREGELPRAVLRWNRLIKSGVDAAEPVPHRVHADPKYSV